MNNNKQIQSYEDSALDRLCNIIDACDDSDVAKMYRHIKEARKWLKSKKQNKSKGAVANEYARKT